MNSGIPPRKSFVSEKGIFAGVNVSFQKTD
jgi:hypothetical protein